MANDSKLSSKTVLVIVFGILAPAFTLYQLATFMDRPAPKKVFEPVPQELFLYLPPLLSTLLNGDTATSFLISTGDFSRNENTPKFKPYVSSVQIVDANQPWPPRWYACNPLYSYEMFYNDSIEYQSRFNLLFGAKIEARQLSYFKILLRQQLEVGELIDPNLAVHILLDKNLEVANATKSNTKKRNVNYHDFRINKKGEKIIVLRKDTCMNLRAYSSAKKDSAVCSKIDATQILDSQDSVLFSWYPLEHINSNLFDFKKILLEKPVFGNNYLLVEWTRITSASWDYDSNLLYSMPKIGIGKISRTDGHIIWAVNRTDIPYVAGKDTLEWYRPMISISYMITTLPPLTPYIPMGKRV